MSPLEYIPGWDLQLWGSLCPQACLQASPLSSFRGLTQNCHSSYCFQVLQPGLQDAANKEWPTCCLLAP